MNQSTSEFNGIPTSILCHGCGKSIEGPFRILGDDQGYRYLLGRDCCYQHEVPLPLFAVELTDDTRQNGQLMARVQL